LALRHTLEGPFRIAHRRRLDEAREVRNECRIVICHGLPTTAFTSHATLRQGRLLQLIETTPDRRASDTGDLVHGDNTAAALRPRLDGREMPPATLVELRAEQPPSLPNRFAVNHDRAIQSHAGLVNRARPSHYVLSACSER
jgi:hypothetical protein